MNSWLCEKTLTHTDSYENLVESALLTSDYILKKGANSLIFARSNINDCEIDVYLRNK
jgi:hypothetical protein